MMSEKSLERVSDSYRRGYMDGYYGKPFPPFTGFVMGFAHSDYEFGYKAGKNDANWAAKVKLGLRMVA